MSHSLQTSFAAAMVAAIIALPAAAQTTVPSSSAPAATRTGIHVGTLEDRAAIEKLMWSYDRMVWMT
jgi:hypothetical protein